MLFCLSTLSKKKWKEMLFYVQLTLVGRFFPKQSLHKDHATEKQPCLPDCPRASPLCHFSHHKSLVRAAGFAKKL